ncbi:GATA transcription factor 16-like [Gossypium australe]|uniref:GATA transcription factor 16-like n=1 Tax=Gossypium australe TaxID=47621 RepID=A0A5B6W1Y1_9ROSI|nr:GATA transcription factor 16-like [Gossypium australe]
MNILQQSEFKETNKRCVDCSTTRTPLWRGGPAGPRVKYRKKNRALLGLNRESRSEKSKRGIEVRRSGIKLKSLGREVGVQHMVGNRELNSKLREEEEAAFLLMALSCGYVYA